MATRVLIYTAVLALGLADAAQGNEPAADAPRQASRTTVDRSGRVLRGQAAWFKSG